MARNCAFVPLARALFRGACCYRPRVYLSWARHLWRRRRVVAFDVARARRPRLSDDYLEHDPHFCRSHDMVHRPRRSLCLCDSPNEQPLARDRCWFHNASVLDELRRSRLCVEDDAASRRLASSVLQLPFDRLRAFDYPRLRDGGRARVGIFVPAVRDHADLHGGREVRLLAPRGGT